MVPGESLSSSWLTRHHRTSHFANTRRPATEYEGLTRDAQLNASFDRLSGRIGTAALCAPVAQRIERRFPKPCVGGSSPLRGATFPPAASAFSFLMPTFRISIFPVPQKALARGGAMCLQWLHNFKASPLMTRSESFGKQGAEGASGESQASWVPKGQGETPGHRLFVETPEFCSLITPIR